MIEFLIALIIGAGAGGYGMYSLEKRRRAEIEVRYIADVNRLLQQSDSLLAKVDSLTGLPAKVDTVIQVVREVETKVDTLVLASEKILTKLDAIKEDTGVIRDKLQGDTP